MVADRYLPDEFEAQWRTRWAEAGLFVTREDPDRPKFYGLEFFPYPSGAGLSVGHCRNYIPSDVICRMKYMQGYNVLHPMGFDAFGLPAENEAIKNRRHPGAMVTEYAATYRRQMELVGLGYDWSRTFASCDASYYRWTQWIFKLLYERGLAYRRDAAVNWDPIDKTVLADEEIVGGRAERSGAVVEKKFIPQWFFKITDYAQRLIDDLDDLNWPEGIKNQQRNWIGRSEGVEFEMRIVFAGSGQTGGGEAGAPRTVQVSDPALAELAAEVSQEAPPTGPMSAEQLRAAEFAARVDASVQDVLAGEKMTDARASFDKAAVKMGQPIRDEGDLRFRVFTTRIDTIFGMTFCVLAPEHPAVESIKQRATAEKLIAIADYQEASKALSDTDRQATTREKTGVFTGAYAVNPANGESVPIYLADYVLMGYGTGAIMAVPAHDARDYEFAKKYGIAIRQVIAATPTGSVEELPWDSKDGYLVNSETYNSMPVALAQTKLGEWVEARGLGSRKINYRLRDWLISRQRYWGCPIPILHGADGREEALPDEWLPALLPEVENYEPSGDGTSPLAHIPEFVNAKFLDGTDARRETDTMGGFACSSWYFLRFADPHNEKEPFDKEKVARWLPVDCYVGGAEHAVMHLLYARFWTKVLYDAGLVPFTEPFLRLENQGQVLANTPYRQPRAGEKLGVGEDGILVSFEEAATLPPAELTWKWARMSKSKGNVVTPDEAVSQFGADALRVFECFVAPFDSDVQWSNEGMQGSVRFLSRIFKLAADIAPAYDAEWRTKIAHETMDKPGADLRRATHQLVAKATDDIDKFAFNTYVSSMMVWLNTVSEIVKGSSPSPVEQLARCEAIELGLLVLAPVAPHSADEIWTKTLGRKGFTYQQPWPKSDPELAKDDAVTVAVQVNGKLRDTFDAALDTSREDLERMAKECEKVAAAIGDQTIRKVIVVPNKLVNFVVG